MLTQLPTLNVLLFLFERFYIYDFSRAYSIELTKLTFTKLTQLTRRAIGHSR